ncbi:MAG: AAA family ATPase [Acidimicrobiales bacterium]
MSGRYEERVRDLLIDASEHAARFDWAGVRALASAALALAPDSADAQQLLREADRAVPSDGERRQLTVMFCDMVGSTALSQDHDPEVVREVLRGYQAACDEVVRRYEGHIARYIGDGVLAYFGHPVAHEDDARRAVKAGLDLLDALHPVTDEARDRFGIDLQIRIAVHTGLVVRAAMGSPGAPDPDAIVGETPNLAARLQERADPGTLVISDATLDLVRGWFLVAPMPPVVLKGIDRAVAAYQVIDEVTTASRVQVQADLSPFVGRQEDLAALEEAWAAASAGEQRVVVITGDPGVGKSRLADVVRRRIQAADGTTLTTGCSSYHTASPLYAVRRLVEAAAGIDSRHDGRHSLPRLWSALDAIGRAELLPLLADLLDLPPEPWCPAPELDGALLREQVLTALAEFLVASTTRSPTMILVDDIQWADATTLELVGRVIARRVPGLLVVATAREGFRVPWPSAQLLPLDRLTDAELRELAGRLPDGRALTPAHLDEVIARSDGVPLFLEELLRTSAVASGGQSRSAEVVPAALRDLLLARFAAPGVDLRLAQLLATIGNEASPPLIAAISGLGPDELDRQLARLVATGTLVRREGQPVTYRFRHHLLADLAYDTQLLPARQRAHAAVADALVTEQPVGVPPDAGALAHHLEHAGRPAEAIEALTLAAEAAQALGAHAEARDLLDHALELLVDITDPVEREHLEVEVRLLRGTGAAAMLGYAAPDAITDFEVCRDILAASEPVGYLDDDPEPGEKSPIGRAWSTAGLWSTLILRGRLDDAEEVSLAIMRKVRPGGLHHQYFEANRSVVQFFRGEYAVAGRGFARCIELIGQLDVPRRMSVPSDALSATRSNLAFVHAISGDLQAAWHEFDTAAQATDELPFPQAPFTRCFVAGMRGAAEITIGDHAAAGRSALEMVQLGERHGFQFWSMVGSMLQAMVDQQTGDPDAVGRAETMVMMLQALDVFAWQPSWLAAIAVGHLGHGQADLALGALDRAAAVAERTGCHYWSAELARLRHEAQLAAGGPPDPALLRLAIDLSVTQGATLFELRSRTDLCRNGGDEADQQALAALLDAMPAAGFTELAEARALVGGRA